MMYFFKNQWGRQRAAIIATSLLFCWIVIFTIPPLVHAKDWDDLASEWGGHIRAVGTLSFPDDQSIYQLTDTGTFVDKQAEVRLNHQLFIGSDWTFETHYEVVALQGDTLRNNQRLRALLPPAIAGQLVGNQTIQDDRRLMNLTKTLDDGDDYVVYHRLDRFNLTHTSGPWTLRLGRQALTWGNGLLFNPMDIFNPFSPTAVQRDYKVGEDMLHVQRSLGDSEVQLLYLPRREPESGDVADHQSSLAGKWRFPYREIEFDLMAARHYEDYVFGIGASGYLGGAAWRWDMTYTLLDDHPSDHDYWQTVVNVDYAWQWRGKNIYGLLEYFYNGLGKRHDYRSALSDPSISERIARGELFTLGQNYLAGQLRFEIHPLFLASGTTIINLADPSAILQPQFIWDAATNFQVILGAGFNWGDDNTEFGGFDFSAGAATIKVMPTDSRYLWLTYFF